MAALWVLALMGTTILALRADPLPPGDRGGNAPEELRTLVSTQVSRGLDANVGGIPITSVPHLTSPKVSRGEARIARLEGRPFVDQ